MVDACLVHLKKRDLFKTVLPSKIFEAAAMAKPIILGVEGEAARLVREAGAGICIEPENAEALVGAVELLAASPGRGAEMGLAGREKIGPVYDYDALAEAYVDVIRGVVAEQGESK
jgi:glycosyltransferase involved in cell wall biosynthesis